MVTINFSLTAKNVRLVKILDSLIDITYLTKVTPLEEHGTSETPERIEF